MESRVLPYAIISNVLAELAETANRQRAIQRLNAYQNNSMRQYKVRDAELFKIAKKLI